MATLGRQMLNVEPNKMDAECVEKYMREDMQSEAVLSVESRASVHPAWPGQPALTGPPAQPPRAPTQFCSQQEGAGRGRGRAGPTPGDIQEEGRLMGCAGGGAVTGRSVRLWPCWLVGREQAGYLPQVEAHSAPGRACVHPS